MRDEVEFSASGTVSVWIGNFQADTQFDDYMNLSRKFETDFGFRLNDRGIHESVVENSPKPIADLVNGFSDWEYFGPAVVEAAKELGVERASTMLVVYAVRYDPTKVVAGPKSSLQYLGSFPFC